MYAYVPETRTSPSRLLIRSAILISHFSQKQKWGGTCICQCRHDNSPHDRPPGRLHLPSGMDHRVCNQTNGVSDKGRQKDPQSQERAVTGGGDGKPTRNDDQNDCRSDNRAHDHAAMANLCACSAPHSGRREAAGGTVRTGARFSALPEPFG